MRSSARSSRTRTGIVEVTLTDSRAPASSCWPRAAAPTCKPSSTRAPKAASMREVVAVVSDRSAGLCAGARRSAQASRPYGVDPKRADDRRAYDTASRRQRSRRYEPDLDCAGGLDANPQRARSWTAFPGLVLNLHPATAGRVRGTARHLDAPGTKPAPAGSAQVDRRDGSPRARRGRSTPVRCSAPWTSAIHLTDYAGRSRATHARSRAPSCIVGRPRCALLRPHLRRTDLASPHRCCQLSEAYPHDRPATPPPTRTGTTICSTASPR